MNRSTTLSRMVLTTVVLGLFASVGAGQYYPADGMAQPHAGQTHNTTTRPAMIQPKAQAMDYLARGRSALQAGNLQEANHWAKQAGTLAATFSPHEDSPQRLQNDIAVAAGAAVNPGASASPASPAPPVGATARHISPTLGTTAPGTPAGYTPAPMSAPVGSHVTNAQAQARSVGMRNKLLVDARIALSHRDVNRAKMLAEQAGAMQLTYPPKMDTHENVLTHIKNYTFVIQKRQQEGDTEGVRRALAKCYIEQSQTLLGWGKLDEASELAYAADRLNIRFNQFETQPRDILARIEAVRNSQRAKNPNAGGAAMPPMTSNPTGLPATLAATPPSEYVTPAGAFGADGGTASPAVYAPGMDATRNVQANENRSPGYDLLHQANTELRQNNREAAKKYVMQAEQYRAELDPVTAQRLSDLHILLFQPEEQTATPAAATEKPGPLANPESDSAMFNQLITEMQNQELKARRLIENDDPRGAMTLLTDYRKKVETSDIQGGQRETLLKSVDRRINELQKYLDDNEMQIRLAEQNRKAEEGVKRDYTDKIATQDRLAEMVEEFNRLQKEQRFAEAEVIGKQAKELFPDEPVAIQIEFTGRMNHRMFINNQTRAQKERAVWEVYQETEVASIPFAGEIEYARDWKEISAKRIAGNKKQTRLNARELEIQKQLQTLVHPNFINQPLSSVLDVLSKATGINIHVDELGLRREGVSPSDMVSLTMQNEISLNSALKLILSPLALDFTIRNEVLLITSKSMKNTDVYQVVYPVADLVIPIPNFAPSSSMGLEGLLRNAYTTSHGGAWQANMMAPALGMAKRNGAVDFGSAPGAVNAQMHVPVGGSSSGSGGSMGSSMGAGYGSSGEAGGAASADFDGLINLITNTVQVESWSPESSENQNAAGPGTISPFPVNLSLVVSQTQEVHDEIANLLEQLRRLQDLQVTIEVRFITLSDTFFEKIGVDFNASIQSKSGDAFTYNQATGRYTPNGSPSATVGQSTYYNQFDLYGTGSGPVQLLQNSSALATAGAIMGGYDATKNFGAQLGFAILSDVEAYFFLEAAQNTERSNILQTPKVTLFNGQQAFVSDTSQTPFVISVTPVVGDFAAALQPVIVVLSEGTFMTVQAVVSPDRRYVRLTVVPYFSQIGDVKTFTFTGTESSVSDTTTTGNQDDPNDNSGSAKKTETNRSGTTVQLPTFSYVTVTTTVSVPDGGTVLLGGIKRLNEGRSESGVPILGKVPFLGRLFKNTSIGRETSSLMMVVTPRIIIHEEEEAAIGVTP